MSLKLVNCELFPGQFKKILGQRSNWIDLSLRQTMISAPPKEMGWNKPLESCFVGKLIP